MLAKPIKLVLAAAAVVLAAQTQSCTVSYDRLPKDADFRVNARSLPDSAETVSLEMYDLASLRTNGFWVNKVCEQRGEKQGCAEPGDEGIITGYYVFNNNGEVILPNQTEKTPVQKSGGKPIAEQPIWVTTDYVGELGSLFLHMVVYDKSKKPIGHVCSCRNKRASDFRINRGQLIVLPGVGYEINPTLHDEICGKGYDAKKNCFTCDSIIGIPNVPCVYDAAGTDGDDADEEGTTEIDPNVELPEDYEPGDDPDEPDGAEQPENDVVEIDLEKDLVEAADENLPIDKRFWFEAEGVIEQDQILQLDQCSPKELVTTLDDKNIRNSASPPFWGAPIGQIVVLAKDCVEAKTVPLKSKMTFMFNVKHPGEYTMKAYYPMTCFFGKVKFYIDDLPMSPLDADVDMYTKAPTGQEARCKDQCSATLPMDKPYYRSNLETIGNNVFLTAGKHYLKVEVVTKNSNSSGYGFGLDHVKFFPVTASE